MLFFTKHKILDLHIRHITTGVSIGLAAFSIVFTTLFLPETLVGKSILLRILFGIIFTSSAIALAFGVTKLLQMLPIGLTAVLTGSFVIIAWCVNNVLTAFSILPFSTSWQMTFAASLLISFMVLCISTGIITALNKNKEVVVLIAIIFVATIAGYHFSFYIYPGEKQDVIDSDKQENKVETPHPETAGMFKFRTLFYGSGTDRHRAEYGAKVNLITEPVDASPFVPKGWSVARTAYWGFDEKRLPINGRVWFPDGKGRFPLVFIVHGAYNMTEPSDTGFAYLGELLASRGFIAVSVDENFLNYGLSRYGDFEESDIDARGWLLLQHLRVWRDWNSNRKSPFFEKVDMGRIALIGHSRGGEAIAAAAAFNRMGRYPRNGNVRFDFNFKIKTLIAFAPSDIYQPLYERTTPASIRDINYLLLLGTDDRQVPSILGSRIFQRVSFSGCPGDDHNISKGNRLNCEHYIKSALYIGRANHSQFNTMWGMYDFPWPYRLFSNTSEQLSGDEQRRIVKIYVSAFLAVTLKGEKRYVPLLRDYNLIREWLPKTDYISRYQDSAFHATGTFDEDIDPKTATVPGGEIIGSDLSLWHEQDIDYHYYQPYGSRSNRVVSVGWETSKNSKPSFRIKLPVKEISKWKLKPTDMLVFSIACPDQRSLPGLRIELTDSAGRRPLLPLNRIFLLKPTLSAYLTKMRFLEKPSPIIVLQTIAIPLSRFQELNSSFDLRKLNEIAFRFDNGSSGTVLLDDIGFEQ